MDSRKVLIFLLLASLSLSAVSSQTDSADKGVFTGIQVKSEWLDVSRLAITHVAASSQQNLPYYDVLNLFDDGKNYINNINYHYWLSMPEDRHWVRLTFDTPVTVASVVIETAPNDAANDWQPKEFALELAELTETTRRLIWISDAVPMQGFVKTCELPRPVSGVNELTIIIPTPRIVAVSELRIFGTVPAGVNTTPQKPTVLTQESERHTIQIQRTFTTDEDLHFITIAENSYPDREKVLAVARMERSNMKNIPETEKLWWYSGFDDVRIPYAITAEAVQYYADLVKQYREKKWNSDIEPRSKLVYSASVKFYPKYSHQDRDFTDVHIVRMKLYFSADWASLAGMRFHKERTVVLDKKDQVLVIFGDGITSVGVI
jgi:hypothetical protein